MKFASSSSSNFLVVPSEAILRNAEPEERVDSHSTAILKAARLQLQQAIEVIEALVGYDPLSARREVLANSLDGLVDSEDGEWEASCALDAVALYGRLENAGVIEIWNNLDQHVFTVGPDISGFDYIGLQGEPGGEFEMPAEEVFECTGRLFSWTCELYRSVNLRR